MKLILGTAEFGPKAYGEGVREPISLNNIRNILECAKRGGIDILEGAEAYNCDELLSDPTFDLIYKVTSPYSLDRILTRTGRCKLMGLMYHHGYETQSQMPQSDNRVDYLGSSVYSFKQLTGQEGMAEVPLNLENRGFEKLTAPVKLVRSVFGRGELLKRHSVKECLAYVKGLPNVHGVVVGVNSVAELQEIIDIWKTI